MKAIAPIMPSLVLSLLFAGQVSSGEFKPIFDGESLSGWRAPNMSYWSVEDGAITAESTEANPCTTNQFLVWQDGEVADFELKLKFRLANNRGNSGIQFRSRISPSGDGVGYQADILPSGGWLGALCDENTGRETLVAPNGHKTVVDADGKRTTSRLGDPVELKKPGRWNDYHIVARGNHIILEVNGQRSAEVIDNEIGHFDLKGILALQLRSGPPMKVQFREILLKMSSAVMPHQPLNMQHYIAAIERDRFHGWPANNGAWQWGNEILVGYTQGDFEKSDGHSIKGIQESKFARSLDGGETWEMFDPDNFLDDDNIKWLPKGKTMLGKPMDFAHDGFAMRVFATGYHGNDDPDGGFYYSYDRGATWNGPHFLGDLNDHDQLRGKVLTPRTDYIVTGPRSCFVFITANVEGTSRIACTRTDDGGLTFNFVTWITPDTLEYRAIMPQTIRLANGDYLLAFRKIFTDKSEMESTIDTYLSKDRCETWAYLSTVKEIKNNSNPPSIVELDDGRLCCVYGDRDAQRIAGKYSDDKGKTWGPEFVIREDYRSVEEWADMGYPRMVQRPDGKLAVMYYWASPQHPQQFIACSVWRPYAPQQQDLFYQGMNGVPVYRIPALTVTNSDVVVAVCDARADRGQDLPNDIDLVMRRSLDAGETWSESQVISDFGKQGGGDAALLVDRNTGRLWCFFTYAPDGVSVKTSRPGIAGDTFQLHLMHSDDDGLTWSTPLNINAEVKRPEWDAVWSSPGRGYQDSEGWLYFPLSRKSGETLYSHFIYSDDHGETWHMGGPAGEATNEWMLVQRSNGDLLGNMRSNSRENRRAVATSPDRGKTWEDLHHHPKLIEPACQACLMWFANGTKEYLLFSNPADTERRRMAVKLSRDEGRTWPIERVLHEGPAAYSCMAVLPDGQIGILYERGEDSPYEKVTFAKCPLEWLKR